MCGVVGEGLGVGVGDDEENRGYVCFRRLDGRGCVDVILGIMMFYCI